MVEKIMFVGVDLPKVASRLGSSTERAEVLFIHSERPMPTNKQFLVHLNKLVS